MGAVERPGKEHSERARTLARLAQEVARIRADAAQVSAQTFAYQDMEAARRLTRAERAALQRLRLRSSELWRQLQVLAAEYERVRR